MSETTPVTLQQWMNKLKKEGREIAEERGHLMEKFSVIGKDERKQIATCIACRAEIHVDYTKPKGQELRGEALTKDCDFGGVLGRGPRDF